MSEEDKLAQRVKTEAERDEKRNSSGERRMKDKEERV